MATKKITDLTQLTDLDATDSFVVNDSGAGADKRVEFSDLQSEVLNGAAIGTSTAITELQVDNLNLNGNTISSTDTNGNVTIDPNGTGSTVLVGDLLVDDKIIHSGDTNTAIRFPSADTVTVETAGSERLRIDSSGNVGIGNSSPTAKFTGYKNLSVSALSGSTLSLEAGGEPRTLLAADSVATYISSFDSNPFIFSVTAGNFSGSTGTEKARITSDGYIRMASGTGGIQFKGNTSADDALDDYEQGTWTPVYEGSTSNPTISYGSGGQDGWYTKIGNLVFLQFTIYTNSVTGGSGDLRIGGVPYAMDGTGNFPVVNGNLSEGSFFTSNGPTSFIISPDAVDGTTILVFPTTIADLASGTSQNRMRGTILYRTA